jgi:hypothetical protein
VVLAGVIAPALLAFAVLLFFFLPLGVNSSDFDDLVEAAASADAAGAVAPAAGALALAGPVGAVAEAPPDTPAEVPAAVPEALPEVDALWAKATPPSRRSAAAAVNPDFLTVIKCLLIGRFLGGPRWVRPQPALSKTPRARRSCPDNHKPVSYGTFCRGACLPLCGECLSPRRRGSKAAQQLSGGFFARARAM